MMDLKQQTYIWVTCRFVAWHRWKDAPPSVAFLRDMHRHEFRVKVTLTVRHLNRDLEFFTEQAELKAFVQKRYEGARLEKSCESIAYEIAHFCVDWENVAFAECEVSEDGENGAIVRLTEVNA